MACEPQGLARQGQVHIQVKHALDGARLKIVRAQEHLDGLKAEIRMYLDEHPNEIIRSQPNGTLQRMDMPSVLTAPPLRLSAIVGDVVTNVRSSLDYIVWELSQKFFIPAFDVRKSEDRRLTAFPIDGNYKGSGFQDRLDVLTRRGCPAGAVKQIHAVQTHGRSDDTLGWLHQLVNTDKHRSPLLTLGTIDHMVITLATSVLYQDIISDPATISVSRDLITRGVPMQSDVQMQGQTTLCVAFEDVTMPREPVTVTLEQIIKTAANIIPTFDRFFV
jgi:hypothetical protein